MMSPDFRNQISALLGGGNTDDAIQALEAYLQTSGNDDEAYLLLGNAYRKCENWEQAMNAYAKAFEINPDSPAKDAYNMILQILNFYDTDRYNV